MDFLDAVGGDESVARIDRAHRVSQLGSPGKVVLERPYRCRAASAVRRAGRPAPAGSADAHPGTGASRSSISAFTLIAQPANAGRPIMGPIHEPTTEGASPTRGVCACQAGYFELEEASGSAESR